MDWFYLTLLFLCLNHFIAIVGIVVYLRKEKEWSTKWLLGTSPFIIIAPLLLDVCMPFYRLLQKYLPDDFVTFMVSYEATRTLSESFLESLPQTCLQVYIYMQCLDVTCAGIEKEGQSALLFSLAISGASLLFHVITTIYEMRKEGLNCCGYFNSLIQMGAGLPLRQSALLFSLAISGASLLFHVITTIYEMRKEGLNCCGYFNSLIQMGVGLPLRAIVSNTIGEELEIDYDLLDGQIRSLGVALRSNTSLEKIEVRKQNDGNGLAMVLDGSNGYQQVEGMFIGT
eukprot:g9753.t1